MIAGGKGFVEWTLGQHLGICLKECGGFHMGEYYSQEYHEGWSTTTVLCKH